MERRFTPASRHGIEIEERAEKTPKIRGYAAVFYDPEIPGTEYTPFEGFAERISATAFDRALREQDDVRALVNHDANLLLGRSASGTLALSTDRTGLRYVVDPPDTQVGRDVLTSIKRGDMTGSSFAFLVDQQVWREMPDGLIVREIESVRLFDVSPVTFPAYEASSTTVRTWGGRPIRREDEPLFDEFEHYRYMARRRRQALANRIALDNLGIRR